MTTLARRLCSPKGHLPFTLALAFGVMMGAATGQMAVWIAVGAGLGAALGSRRS